MELETYNLDLSTLLKAEETEARRDVVPESLENVSHLFVRENLQNIANELNALCCRAMTEVDQLAAANEAADRGEKSTLRCRVRKKPSTLEISWERQFYFERKSPPKAGSKSPCFTMVGDDGKKRLYGLKSKHIRKGLSDRYSQKALTFDTEPEWATEIVGQMEDKFEIIRRQTRLLGQIRKMLYHYDQLSKKYFDLVVGEGDNPKRIKPVVASDVFDEDDSN